MTVSIPLISFHGSHSGQFCSHAPPGTLEEIVCARLSRGFSRFGLTEHQFIDKEAFFYVEDKNAGRSVSDLVRIFSDYMEEARRLQEKYGRLASILVGFETEVYDFTCFELIRNLRQTYKPDYIVGSLHHVAGVAFDTDETTYRRAVKAAGGLADLYRAYYDTQAQLIEKCHPEVIGHFDIVKIFSGTDEIPTEIRPLILRNIEAVIEYGGLFEVNTRSFKKGLSQPYPGEEILKSIAAMGGEITLADDSHCIEDIGYGFDRLTALLPKYFNSVAALEKTVDGLEKKRIPFL